MYSDNNASFNFGLQKFRVLGILKFHPRVIMFVKPENDKKSLMINIIQIKKKSIMFISPLSTREM